MIEAFLQNAKEEQVFNRLTEYQDKTRNYERMHYCPSKDLTNELGRSRWFYRISISKMIYCTFLLFFDEVIEHFLGSDSHNYEKNIISEFIEEHFSLIYKFIFDVKYFLKRFNFKKEIVITTPPFS